jgi:CheY-like chemotaxis protein
VSSLFTPQALAQAQKQRLRILVAEDNPVNQKVARGILTRLGHDVEVVDDGHRALEELARSSFDLVLMDVQMPRMGGLEATRCIRAPDSAVKDPSVPIIALTAHAMKGDRDRCLEAGMDDYVTKPVRPDVLAEAVARWTKGGGARQRKPSSSALRDVS